MDTIISKYVCTRSANIGQEKNFINKQIEECFYSNVSWVNKIPFKQDEEHFLYSDKLGEPNKVLIL